MRLAAGRSVRSPSVACCSKRLQIGRGADNRQISSVKLCASVSIAVYGLGYRPTGERSAACSGRPPPINFRYRRKTGTDNGHSTDADGHESVSVSVSVSDAVSPCPCVSVWPGALVVPWPIRPDRIGSRARRSPLALFHVEINKYHAFRGICHLREKPPPFVLPRLTRKVRRKVPIFARKNILSAFQLRCLCSSVAVGYRSDLQFAEPCTSISQIRSVKLSV